MTRALLLVNAMKWIATAPDTPVTVQAPKLSGDSASEAARDLALVSAPYIIHTWATLKAIESMQLELYYV